MPSMRPKKPRFVDGVRLSDNLYTDPRGRIGYYSYRRPDGTKKTFQADTPHIANELAEQANNAIGVDHPALKKIPSQDQLEYHKDTYIKYRERITPKLKEKASWKNRKYTIGLFAKEFPQLSHIKIEPIREWWDGLTYHQQKLRMAEFRRLFNWLMAEGLTPKIKYNPFTTADDLPRLMLKEKPQKERLPLTQLQYEKIYKKAPSMGYEALCIAMSISRYTTLREADICALRLDKNIVDNKLRTVVSKSAAQRGVTRAVRLEWDLEEHPVLRKIINRARKLALKNKACPFIVSHKPKRRVWNQDKDHLHQVTNDRLSRMFKEVMEECGISETSFHEVRGLSSTLYRLEGYNNSEIQEVMGHESERTTEGYQNLDEIPHIPVTMKLKS